MQDETIPHPDSSTPSHMSDTSHPSHSSKATMPPTIPPPNERMAPFLEEMAARFLSRQNNVFLVTGNVNDLIESVGVEDADCYTYLDRYIAARLQSRGRLVVAYNIARGIDFAGEEVRERLREFFATHDERGPLEDKAEHRRRALLFDRRLAESQAYSFLTLKFLEELCRIVRANLGEAPGRVSIVIKHAETLVPDAAAAQLAEIDRQKLTLLREWFTDPDFIDSAEQVILVSNTAAGFHSDLRGLPQMAQVHVPLPDSQCRARFIAWSLDRLQIPNPGTDLAGSTAGMTLLTIQGLLLRAKHQGGGLREEDLLDALNRLLTSELGDKIEMLKPAHRFSDVIGASALKKELGRLTALLDTRDPAVAPVGILVAGPNGVGKTFIFEAWAAECNRLVIVLKNLRGMYFGQTDQIFEKLRTVLEALGNVIVFIDEADTVFGKPGRDTHETEARLFGNLIRMMGDPRNRGKIVWILVTARPENLAPDLKRSGRAGLHLPVFDPEGPDRTAYLDHILSRAGFDATILTKKERHRLEEATGDLSPADFNELLVELRAEAALHGPLELAKILDVVGNIMPGEIGPQRRAQTLNAFLECSRKSLVPDSLAKLDRAAARAELDKLRFQQPS